MTDRRDDGGGCAFNVFLIVLLLLMLHDLSVYGKRLERIEKKLEMKVAP